jgi:hypothetical protein
MPTIQVWLTDEEYMWAVNQKKEKETVSAYIKRTVIEKEKKP